MVWTDDPVRDYESYDRERYRRLSRYPKCDCCGERITTESFYRIKDENLCEACLDYYREDTEDYIREDE